jgi:hypothetical protein
MPESPAPLLVLALLAAVVLVAWWHRHAFIVRMKHGKPRLLKGKLTAAFLEELAEVCRESGVRHGWLGGIRRGKRISLVFSWHFSAPVRQRLRNLWMLHA